MRRLTVILGVPVDELTLDEALDRVEGFAARGGRLHQVATVNSDFLARAQEDPELLHILCQVDLATADGMPLVWASRMLGGAIPERVTGADLVPALAGRFAKSGRSLFLLGARPEVARTAAERLRERFPGLRISGVYSPPPADLEAMDHAEILRRVNAARPDALLVAFGNPKQEKWIYRHRHSLEVPVAIGIGASLDFIAGTVRRAPVWLQRAGAEWLWRLGNEPGRLWRRYAGDIGSLGPGLARHWLLTRRTHCARQAQGAVDGVLSTGPGSLSVGGRFDAGRRVAFEAAALKSMEAGSVGHRPERVGGPETRDQRPETRDPERVGGAGSVGHRPERMEAAEWREGVGYVRVDLRGCTFIDSAGLGCLASLAHEARANGLDIRVHAGSPAIRKLLDLGRLNEHIGAVDDVEGVG